MQKNLSSRISRPQTAKYSQENNTQIQKTFLSRKSSKLQMNFEQIPDDLRKNLRPSTATWSENHANNFIKYTLKNPQAQKQNAIKPCTKVNTDQFQLLLYSLKQQQEDLDQKINVIHKQNDQQRTLHSFHNGNKFMADIVKSTADQNPDSYANALLFVEQKEKENNRLISQIESEKQRKFQKSAGKLKDQIQVKQNESKSSLTNFDVRPEKAILYRSKLEITGAVNDFLDKFSIQQHSQHSIQQYQSTPNIDTNKFSSKKIVYSKPIKKCLIAKQYYRKALIQTDQLQFNQEEDFQIQGYQLFYYQQSNNFLYFMIYHHLQDAFSINNQYLGSQIKNLQVKQPLNQYFNQSQIEQNYMMMLDTINNENNVQSSSTKRPLTACLKTPKGSFIKSQQLQLYGLENLQKQQILNNKIRPISGKISFKE